MWLLAGQRHQITVRLLWFRTGFLLEACEDLFYQMVRRLKDAGELSVETVFIDGTKLEACANKYTFVWKNLLANGKKRCFRKSRKQYCS